MRLIFALPVGFAYLLLSGAQALAAPMIFFGQDNAGSSLPVPNSVAAQTDFLSNVANAGVEDFESFPAGQGPDITATFSPFGDTATISGFRRVLSGSNAGRFPISGTQSLETNDGQGLSISFSSPQAAFGFFATDVGDVNGQLTLSFDGGAPILVPHTVNGPNGTGLFFGIIDPDNPFTTVMFDNTNGNNDGFGFDDFTIGRQSQVVVTPVPEPTSLAIWGLGAIGILAAARRRRLKRISLPTSA